MGTQGNLASDSRSRWLFTTSPEPSIDCGKTLTSRLIENIARELGMSVWLPSSLQICHCHEPLQFQKQLRLQEARRLMLGQNLEPVLPTV